MCKTVSIGVMTYNVIAGMRVELLERTIKSIDIAFPDARKTLCDNGSTDGTDSIVEVQWKHWSKLFVVSGENNTPGYGRNLLLEYMLKQKPSIIVSSDDDMEWKEGAQEKLTSFWNAPECPDDLAIVAGLLEPVWSWNTPRSVVEAGGVRVLVRDNAPGAAWSFRCGANANGISKQFKDGPHPVLYPDFGYDHKKCLELLSQGQRVAQIDLAEHIGWGYSTHGNESDKDGKPLDREFWGV